MVKYSPAQRPILVTVKAARYLTGLGNTKIYELIGAKKLKSITVGRRRLIVFASIEDLLKTNEEAAWKTRATVESAARAQLGNVDQIAHTISILRLVVQPRPLSLHPDRTYMPLRSAQPLEDGNPVVAGQHVALRTTTVRRAFQSKTRTTAGC
jgi:excisionase family DNA binding protein